MKLANAIKDRKFREELITNILLFITYEFMLYIVYFELPLNYTRFKLRSFIIAGIAMIIGIILLSLGIGNKNRKFKFYSCEAMFFALSSFLAEYVLSRAPQTIMIKSKTIYLFIPFVVFLVYYIVKEIVIIKNKLKK